MNFLTKEQFENQAFIYYIRTGEIHYYEDYLKHRKDKLEFKSLMKNGKIYLRWKVQENPCKDCLKLDKQIFEWQDFPPPLHKDCKCEADIVIRANCARISSAFEDRIHPITGQLIPHNGVDFAAPAGTPIISIDAGIVLEAGWHDKGQLGYFVKIQTTNGDIAIYGHMLEKPAVNAGDQVKQGTLLGYVGSTGQSSGNHLHYGKFDKYGKPIKPSHLEQQQILALLMDGCKKK